MAMWIWLRYTPDVNEKVLSKDVDPSARIECIKEGLTFYRTVLFGLIAAYIGLVVAALTALDKYNNLLVTERKESFLVNLNSFLQMSSFSFFLLATVLRELFLKRERLQGCFASIESKSHTED